MTPRRSTRIRTLDTIADDIARCLQPVDDGNTTAPLIAHAITRLNNARPGHPGATSYDGPGGTGSIGHRADRTGELVAAAMSPGTDDNGKPLTPGQHTTPRPGATDPSSRDRGEIDHLLRNLMRDARRLVDVIERNAPRIPTRKARTTTTTTRTDDPGCAWCATIPGPAGLAPWWQLIHRTTTLNGALPEPTPLCHACIRRHADTGRRPSRGELETKRDTERWPHTHQQPRRTGTG